MSDVPLLLAVAIASASVGALVTMCALIIYLSRKLLGVIERNTECLREMRLAINVLSQAVRQFAPYASQLDDRGRWTRELNNERRRKDKNAQRGALD